MGIGKILGGAVDAVRGIKDDLGMGVEKAISRESDRTFRGMPGYQERGLGDPEGVAENIGAFAYDHPVATAGGAGLATGAAAGPFVVEAAMNSHVKRFQESSLPKTRRGAYEYFRAYGIPEAEAQELADDLMARMGRGSMVSAGG